MTMIGDIVTIAGQTGKWTVLERHESGIPPGMIWRLCKRKDDGNPIYLTSGEGNFTLLLRPVITVGQTVRLNEDFDAVVAAVDTERVTLTLSAESRREHLSEFNAPFVISQFFRSQFFNSPFGDIGSDNWLNPGEGKTEMGLGYLVFENASRLLGAM